MVIVFRISLILFLAFGLISCSSNESASSSSGGGSGGGGGNSGSSSSNLLEITIRRNYEGHTRKVIVGTCAITPTDVVTQKTCNINIPELDLYYSDLEFTVSTNNASTCALIAFQPYYYVRSTSNAFSKDGETGDTDCQALPTDLYCFGGAAKTMVEGFPLNRANYFLPIVTLKDAYVLKSTNTLRESDQERSMSNNTGVANNLTNRASNISNTNVRYVGNSLVDYSATCYDPWYKTNYKLTLILGDDDTIDTASNSSIDEVYDWGN